MNKIELLAPAGNLEKAKIAILYGADAVYIGGKQFSLRSRASNFSIDEIAELVKFANAHNSHVHVTVNMLPHESDLDGIEEYLKTLDSIGVHAIIVASPSIMMLAKKLGCKFEVHVSTQHSSTNSSAARFWKEKGMDRVVLARECQMNDIRSICEENILPIEVFIHGGMCISFSGRCVLSNHMTLRDANRGGCAQSCRWKYHLMDGQTELSDPTNLFSMSSKDLQAVDYIEDFIHMGVASLKIEGRMKTALYVATVARTYRKAIDDYLEDPQKYRDNMPWYLDQISNCTYRQFTTGFFFGKPDHETQIYDNNTYIREYTYLGIVGAVENGLARIEQRNKFSVGETIEIMKPDGSNVEAKVLRILNEDGEEQESAPHSKQVLHVELSETPAQYDLLRRQEEDKEVNS